MNHNPPTNGFDKRKHHINRLGRPKSFDTLRNLAQQIAHEKSGVKTSDGRELTVVEAILRSLAQSNNPQKVLRFLEIAFGKDTDYVTNTNFNIDLNTLTERQLERLANGDDLDSVLADKSESQTPAPPGSTTLPG